MSLPTIEEIKKLSEASEDNLYFSLGVPVVCLNMPVGVRAKADYKGAGKKYFDQIVLCLQDYFCEEGRPQYGVLSGDEWIMIVSQLVADYNNASVTGIVCALIMKRGWEGVCRYEFS